MEVIITFKFENAGEAEVFTEALRTYPAASKADKLEQIGDIVLVRAVGRDAAKDILIAAGRTFDVPASGRYPWGTEKSN